MAEQQKSFADYVKDLMGILPTVNNNPMLSVTSQTDADKYRENPFYMQEAIRKRIADEEAAKKAAQSRSGMFGVIPSAPSNGSDSKNVELTPEQIAFLEKETPDERYARITGDWFGLKPMAAYLVGGYPGLMAQQGYTPEAMMDRGIGLFRQATGDTSGYVSPTFQPKPAGVAAPISGGTSYTPSSLQETMNRTGGVLTPQQAQAVVNYVSSGESSGGGGFGYGGQDGRGGQTDSALTGYTE